MAAPKEENVITQTGTAGIRSYSVLGTVNDETFKNFLAFHRDCVARNVTEAFIYIDSPGGYVHSYRSIQALISSAEVTYHTIAMGHACSAACLMSAQGQFRWAIPNCEFMFHDVGFGAWGKVDEVEESVGVTKRFCKPDLQGFANQTDKPLSWWMAKAKETERNDFYFTAQEALEWGVIDFIGTPIVDTQPNFFVELPVTGDELAKKIKRRQTKPKEARKVPAKKAAKKSKPNPKPKKKR
jgi:ATP-dependent protease ClpP protease subunit